MNFRSILQLLEVGISPQAVVCALREILLKPKADKPKHPHGHMTYDTFSSTQQSIQQVYNIDSFEYLEFFINYVVAT